jgi:putative peptidoglycan lipid II flippase
LLVTGSISWLYFSDRLIELPLAVFGIAISIVILPVLSEYFQRKESNLYSIILAKSIRLSILIAVPSMIGLIILSSSIISTLYMYGNFEILDVNMTVLSLITYSLGLPAFIFLKILVTAFYSRQDTKTPVIYSLIGISINIIFNLTILYFYLKTPFDGAHALIALATSLSAWVQVLLMSYKLKSLGIIKENLFFNLSSLKIVLAALSMFLFLFFYGNILPFDYDTSMYERAGYLIANIFVGSIIYFVSLMLLGVKTKSYKI